MSYKIRFQLPAGLFSLAAACALLLVGCQGSESITSPVGKPGYEGIKPPPSSPPANPAIAFRTPQGNNARLNVMNADGSNAAVILTMPGTGVEYLPSWSPNGESIAFFGSSGAAHWNLYRIDVSVVNGVPTGSNMITLVNRSTSATNPAWSPLGDQIAFVDSDLRTVEVMPATGGAAQVLYTSPTYRPGATAWSRDGSQIAFLEWDNAAGGFAIKTVDVTTLAVSTVLDAAFSHQAGATFLGYLRGLHLDWARTRDALAFDIMDSGENYTSYTLDLTGGSPVLVANGSGPTWSPDDSAIAFRGPRKLSKINLATGQITETSATGTSPDWRRF